MNEPSSERTLTNRDLYDRQKRLLQTFLEHGAISPEQYRVSLQGLQSKMKL